MSAPDPTAPARYCPTPGCFGDARYAAPGRNHREGCTYPTPFAIATGSDAAPTNPLTDFLLARIAEDEAWNRQNHGGDPSRPGSITRVKADLDAKRQIAALFPDAARDGDGWNEAGAQVLELLALPYADHEDYREEWKP